MDKKQEQELKTVTGYIVHEGLSNSPRCVIEEPGDSHRRWILHPAAGNKSRTGIITMAVGGRLYEFVKAHRFLRFIKTSEQVEVAAVAATPPAATRRNTITNAQKRYKQWKEEKVKAKAKLPKPLDPDSANGPSPKQLLEVAEGMTPKRVLDPPPQEIEKVAEEVAPEPMEPIEIPVVDTMEAEGDPIALPIESPVEPEAVAVNTEEALSSMSYEELVDVAERNSIDLGRTRTLNGALNKIFKHMDETGEGIVLPTGEA